MRLIPVLVLTVMTTLSAYAQERWSVGVQGGLSMLVGETTLVVNQLPEFEASGNPDANAFLFSRYYFTPKWAVRAGAGIMVLSTNQTFRGVPNTRQKEDLNHQFLLSVDRMIPFGHGGWGAFLSVGLNSMSLVGSKAKVEQIFSPAGDRRFGTLLVRDADGNVSSLLAHDVELTTRDTQFVHYIRPEFGVYKNIHRHSLFVTFAYGHALGDPVFKKDFKSISLHNVYYAAKHEFSGSYRSLQLGYEFRF